MKKFLLAVLMGFYLIAAKAQTSDIAPKIIFHPYVMNGIDFIQNDIIKENYKTQSKYHIGFGLQIGHPANSKFIPFVQYSYSKFQIEKDNVTNDLKYNSLLNNQFLGGLIIPLKKFDDYYITSKFGYTYSTIKESFYNIDADAHGFVVGVGLEKKIFKYYRIFLNADYNFQKTGQTKFRDFDVTKLSFGFVL